MNKTHLIMWVLAVEYRPGLLLIDLQASHTLQALIWGHSGLCRSSSYLVLSKIYQYPHLEAMLCLPDYSVISGCLDAPGFLRNCLWRLRSSVSEGLSVHDAVPPSQHLRPCRVLGATHVPAVTFSFPCNVGLPFRAVRPFSSEEKSELPQAWLVTDDLPR